MEKALSRLRRLFPATFCSKCILFALLYMFTIQIPLLKSSDVTSHDCHLLNFLDDTSLLATESILIPAIIIYHHKEAFINPAQGK